MTMMPVTLITGGLLLLFMTSMSACSSGVGEGAEGVHAGSANSVSAESVGTNSDNDSAHESEISLDMHIVSARSAISSPFEVRITARNVAKRAQNLLLWNTPFEATLSADLFDIRHEGQRLEYRGRMVKRLPPPPAEAYRRIPPGESIEVVLDLADVYALNEPGNYELRYADRLFDSSQAGTSSAVLRSDDVLTFVRTGE